MPAAAVITVSDSCYAGTRVDRSGPAAVEVLIAGGFTVVEQRTVPDEQPEIERALRDCAGHAALVVTTGGTGIAVRDVTPEATRKVCDRLLDGVPEVMRAEGRKETIHAALSRALCGTLGESLIVNLPSSTAVVMSRSARGASPRSEKISALPLASSIRASCGRCRKSRQASRKLVANASAGTPDNAYSM